MNIWQDIYRMSLIALVVLIALGMALLLAPKLRRQHVYQQKMDQLEENIRQQSEYLNDLRVKQERFKNDPEFVEQVAHEKGRARTNEVLFTFPGHED